jgi:hypothetical protein
MHPTKINKTVGVLHEVLKNAILLLVQTPTAEEATTMINLTNPTDRAITALAESIMRGVVKSGVDLSTDTKIDNAIKVMRAEMMAFLTGDEYAAERECVMLKSLDERYVVASVVAGCVAKLAA